MAGGRLRSGFRYFGVDISSVREIIRLQQITRAPNMPEFVEGTINLRGKVTPVIDLRERFGLPIRTEDKDNRIVVVDIGGEEVGVIVDAVTEVLRVSGDSVEPPSSVIISAGSDYLIGVAKLDSMLIILLDLERALGDGAGDLKHLELELVA